MLDLLQTGFTDSCRSVDSYCQTGGDVLGDFLLCKARGFQDAAPPLPARDRQREEAMRVWIRKLIKLAFLVVVGLGLLHALSVIFPERDYEYAAPHTSTVKLWWNGLVVTAQAGTVPECDCTEQKLGNQCPDLNTGPCITRVCVTTGNSKKKCKQEFYPWNDSECPLCENSVKETCFDPNPPCGIACF